MQVSVRHLIGFLSCLVLCAMVTTVAGARTWYVPSQAPTLQAAVDSSLYGDEIVLAPGVYDDCAHANYNGVLHIAVLRTAITVRGATGDPADVVLDAGGSGRCLEARQLPGTVVVADLTLRGGRASSPFGSGGGALLQDTRAEFRNCIFDSCSADYAGGGLSAAGADLRVEDCLFVGCGTPNVGGALRTTGANVRIIGTTIHGTTGPAIHYSEGGLAMKRVLVTGGDGAAIVRNLATDEPPYLSCCNLWGNGEDWSEVIADQLGTAGNINADPVYCDPFTGNLNLHATSPCAPEQAAWCELIGARPVVCGGAASRWVLRPDGSGDAPTIQAALDAAAVGDTIILESGTYAGTGNRDLSFGGKAVTVRGNTGDPADVVIDCGGSPGTAHRGFVFANGESRLAVVRHLTISGGDTDGDGGGIWCSSSPTIEGCVVTGNSAWRGAGIYVENGAPLITGCRFEANEGRWHGGGAALVNSAAEIVDCLFHANWGKTGGSAVLLAEGSAALLRGSTVWSNGTDPEQAAVSLSGFSTLELDHAIIGGSNHLGVRCFDGSSAVAVTCDIWGNAGGDWVGALAGQEARDGNVSTDPQFCDPAGADFSIRVSSPCAPDSTGDGAPIGAFAPACSADGLAATGPGPRTAGAVLLPCRPNPCNPATEVAFVLEKAGRVELGIFDAAGRRVAALAEGHLDAGPHHRTWRGRDRAGRVVATGVYFVRLSSPRGAVTRPLTLLR